MNKAIRELIVSELGDGAWAAVAANAGCTDDVIIGIDNYPDALTYRLVAATAEHMGITQDAVLEAFGRYWVHYTQRQGYGALFRMAGDTLGEFLSNLDTIHVRVSLAFPELRPPEFRCTELPDGALRLRYRSERAGLTPMVIGLLRGLADHFSLLVVISHDVRRADGADHDEFLICTAA